MTTFILLLVIILTITIVCYVIKKHNAKRKAYWQICFDARAHANEKAKQVCLQCECNAFKDSAYCLRMAHPCLYQDKMDAIDREEATERATRMEALKKRK